MPRGFRLPLEATWLWRAPSIVAARAPGQGILWSCLQDSSELAKWETAWSGSPLDDLLTQSLRLFLPALLTDPDIALLAVCQQDSTAAGAIANRTDNIVGLSSHFAPPEDSISFWASRGAIAEERLPGLRWWAMSETLNWRSQRQWVFNS